MTSPLPPLPPELDPRRPRRHRRTGAAALSGLPYGMALRVIAAALSVLLVVYIGFLWKTVRGINDVPRLNLSALGPQNPAPVLGASSGSATASATPFVDIDGTDQNILIAGNDDRSGLTNAQVSELKVGRDGGSENTDTMMIVHIPADGAKATLISLPRDSYVSIPGYGMDRLNAAYPDAYINASGSHKAKSAAGANELIETVDQLTGLHIDHFVQISLLGFVRLADAIPGGVEVNLCENVDDTVARDRDIGLQGGSGLVLSKGVHHISGVTALEFVRQREQLPGEDLGRTARQRYFLTSAFRSIASAGVLLDPSRISALIDAMKQSLYIDQNMNVLDLAEQMSNLSANNIIGKVIPDDGPEQIYRGSSYADVTKVDPAKIRSFVQKLVDGPSTAAYQHAKAAAASAVSVAVRNQGGGTGAAVAAVKALTAGGIKAKTDTTAGRVLATTTIEYPAGTEGRAKTLARYVPGAAVEQAAVPGVTLIMGADGLVARSAPSKASPATAKKKTKTAIDASCIP